jgi:lipoyl(octanoyl) transferase
MPEDRALCESTDRALRAYLLGSVDFDAILRLQRRLVYEIAGDRFASALIVCEHPPIITVGRDGSREHIRFEPNELATRGWPIRWVNRGGGCLLHAAGQIAAYFILALDQYKLDLHAYLDRLHGVVLDTLARFDVTGETRSDRAGIYVDGRLIAHVGIAVRDWITYYGLTLNVNPDLEPFRRVLAAGLDEPPMTSLERERRSQVRIATVRQQLVESFAARFGFERISPFHFHPALTIPVASHAIVARPA